MTTVKVDRLLLLASLQQERAAIEAKFKKATEKYKAERESYGERLALALEKAATKVRQRQIPKETHYGRVPKFDLPPLPETPIRDRRSCDMDRLITTLELSKELSIPVREDSEYLKFACKV